MEEKNEFEEIKTNIKDSVKRPLTGNRTFQKIKLKLKDEEDEIIINNNNNRAFSINISTDKTITPEDLQFIHQFKDFFLIINYKYDKNILNDMILLRFLKSANYNMKNAHKKIMNFIKFYNEYKINEIKLSDFPNIDKIKLFYPHNFHKTSILGEPIFIQMLGQLKINEINKLLKEPLLTKYIVFKLNELEQRIFPKCSTYYKRNIDKIFVIIDLMGLTTSLMNKKVYNFITKQINIVSNYFPGILGSLYFINTGFIFRSIWSTCKYLYNNKTRNRIKLLGFQYKNELLSKIKDKDLPKFFGGLCNCEPYGCLFSDQGPWNENKIITKGEKRRGKNYLEILEQKKKNMDENGDEIDFDQEKDEEKIDIQNLNDQIINQNLDIEEIKGPNDI